MQFSLLDSKMNDTCDGMNFTHFTYLLLLHYLVNFETPKMYVNTTSACNVNYNICKKLISLKHCVRSQITRLKLQMHVNTTSACNVNYKIAATCIKLH